MLKFGLSEKHTKFEKICLMVLTNQLIYLVNVKTIGQIFSNYACFSKSSNFKVYAYAPVVYTVVLFKATFWNRNSSVWAVGASQAVRGKKWI